MLNNRQLYLFRSKFIHERDCVLDPVKQAEKELNSFWKHPKTNSEKGKLYEMYVGYIYEEAGYHVEYSGINKGVKDMGRDLICRHGSSVLIIQCKNWEAGQIINVKHIHQLYGTVAHYAKQYLSRQVRGVFYTTTKLSPEARAASDRLNIELHEHHHLPDTFPVIKCKSDVMKYYLPDDWVYDSINMNLHDNDCYLETIIEAEQKGFTRG